MRTEIINLWDWLDEYSDSVYINVNDTFGYACGDSELVDIYDLPKLIEISRKYGYCGVTAFVAKIRDCAPIEPRITEKYIAAKKELEHYTLFENEPASRTKQFLKESEDRKKNVLK